MLFTCRETVTRLDAYGAHALSAREQMGVRAHLNHCASCRAEFAKAKRLTRAVRHAMAVVPPPGYMESLPTRLAARDRSSRGSTGWVRPVRIAGLAAAALLFVALGRSLWQSPQVVSPRALTAPASVSTSMPTVVKAAHGLAPRTSVNAAKRDDLMKVVLVAVEPREIAGAQVALSPAPMGRSEGPTVESWRIDQLIAAILRPRREAARSVGNPLGGALYPTGAEAVALARQSTYDARNAGLGGLTAFVSGSVSVIADVTLPLY